MGVLDFFRAKQKKEQNKIVFKEGTITAMNKTPQGSYGTEIYSGYPYEEYLAALRGTRGARIYDQMRRSDPQVVMILAAIKNPIKSATWSVEAASNDPQDEADRDLINHILFSSMDQTFSKFLNEALTMVDFGHSVFEIIHKPVLEVPEIGSYTGLKELSFRSQKTIEKWNVNPDGSLKSITQMANGDLNKTVNINSEFLLVFSLNMEGANYEGISMLRSLYGPWFRKNNYLKWNAVGIEKFAVPTPILTVPSGMEGSDQFNAAVDNMENFTQYHSNYLIKPAGWELDLHSNTYDPSKVEMSIDSEDKRMAKAVMANFLELGMGSSGSYALSNDLSDFFLSGLDQIGKLICDKINKELIPHLIKINRGDRLSYPKLKVTDISDKAGKELAEILDTLARNKFIQPDKPLEDNLRERYKLPIADEATKRETSNQQNFGQQFSEKKTLSERVRRMLDARE